MSSHSYKVICQKCNRYEYHESMPTQEEYDDWQCTLCSPRKDGVIRPKVSLIVCGKCSQTFPAGEDCPNCGPIIKTKTYTMGNIGNPKTATVTEHAMDSVEKGERILKNRVRQEIEAKERRDKNIEALLIEQTKLLKKLVRMEKKK